MITEQSCCAGYSRKRLAVCQRVSDDPIRTGGDNPASSQMLLPCTTPRSREVLMPAPTLLGTTC
jgi:hypothetical protein